MNGLINVINQKDHISISKTPKVAGKGQLYFINKFKDMETKKLCK